MSAPRIVSSGIWDRITTLAARHPRRCHIAVAYFGNGASKLLPLKKGSVLVVDMSLAAVKSGQTKPAEILKLLKAGAEVHSVENLHAKVFVLGNQAIVGSANASQHSAQCLVEAALESDDEAAVASCRQFVLGLGGEFVTPHHARRMQKEYRPPRFAFKKKAGSKPHHSPLWIIPLFDLDWDPEDQAAADQGMPTAVTKLSSTKSYRVDTFCWLGGGDFLDRLQDGHQLMQLFHGGKYKGLWPAGRVVHIERYPAGRGKRAIVFLEMKKHLKRKTLSAVIQRLGSSAKLLRKVKGPRLLRNAALVHGLLNLWLPSRTI